MSIALLVGRDKKEQELYSWFTQEIYHQLKLFDPSVDIHIWPEIDEIKDIDLILAWRHPLGILKKFPQLKCIASLGAGVDHLMVDQEIPKHVPIIRVMDPYMANDILHYVLTYVLHYVKRVDHWDDCQIQKAWIKKPPFNFADKTVGIMGLGFLGKKAAQALQQIGLKVIGWSNSRKNIPGIQDYEGNAELIHFLSLTDILVCLLPLTPQTENILNDHTLSQLKPNACLINLGRGEHLVEADLISSLDSGQLSAAYLDVFRQEPLPTDHPFWRHPKIRITPHIASVTHPQTAVPQLIETYRKLLMGKVVNNVVDLARGY